ncbi:MAG TPA: spore maturation protein [Candidatus Adamsella sp.]|nr:spore maturation protein [Candidatus Adamsella sp.]
MDNLKYAADVISLWILPVMVVFILLFGAFKRVAIYEAFVEGARSGFSVGVKIIPYLVAILVAIGMFRASGAIDLIEKAVGSVFEYLKIPVDMLPLMIVRPLSGSGALGIMSEIVHEHGGNSYAAKMAAVMLGSSETTFYVLSVYFGAVGITKFRHALHVGIISDIIGIAAAVCVSRFMF